jgi:hypothetical protein
MSYLQDKLLIRAKPENRATRLSSSQMSRVEQELKSDLNYLNVFVNPIGQINIFQ